MYIIKVLFTVYSTKQNMVFNFMRRFIIINNLSPLSGAPAAPSKGLQELEKMFLL